MPYSLRSTSGIALVSILSLCAAIVVAQQAVVGPPTQTATTYNAKIGSIGHVDVAKDPSGTWWVEFDYTYNPPPGVKFKLTFLPRPDKAPPDWDDLAGLKDYVPVAGTHQVRLPLQYPGQPTQADIVEMRMVDSGNPEKLIASYWSKQTVVWRDPATERHALVDDPEEKLKIATALLDGCDSNGFREARTMAENLIRLNPANVGAYVQLARAVMKTNWNEEGLKQAEHLLNVAIKLSPTDGNTLILLGYVYTNQNRLQEAERLFKAANVGEPKNLWLWTNWGDLLVAKGEMDKAKTMYRKAVQHGRGNASCDMARVDAFRKLIALLEPSGDSDELFGLYEHRFHQYGIGQCYGTSFASYLTRVRGDIDHAVELMNSLKGLDCRDEVESEVMGLAQYAASARDPTGGGAALNLARVFLPVGARTMYLLAGSPHTLLALQQLKKSGIAIDQVDGDKNTALAIALEEHNYRAAEALVRLGANTLHAVGESKIPLALLPVMTDDMEGVRLMRRLGVDYGKVRFNGATASEIAKLNDNEEMTKLLGGSGTKL
jgi:tetratricopeptide (TPR) repeat protein